MLECQFSRLGTWSPVWPRRYASTFRAYASGGVGRFVYAAARALATKLAAPPDVRVAALDVSGRRVLELGCGVGLVGLVAARCGAASVLMTDHADASVQQAASNAALAGLTPPRVRDRNLGRCQQVVEFRALGVALSV